MGLLKRKKIKKTFISRDQRINKIITFLNLRNTIFLLTQVNKFLESKKKKARYLFWLQTVLLHRTNAIIFYVFYTFYVIFCVIYIKYRINTRIIKRVLIYITFAANLRTFSSSGSSFPRHFSSF